MADVGVRAARDGDQQAVATAVLATWREGYAHWLGEQVLAQLTEQDVAAQWREAITRAPSPRHHVMVAEEARQLVGLAAWAPADDGWPDGEPGIELGPLLVVPRFGRRGHGSRLLAAVTDIATAEGARHALAWLPEPDTASQSLLGTAGWVHDGQVRELDAGSRRLREIRWVVGFGEPDGSDGPDNDERSGRA